MKKQSNKGGVGVVSKATPTPANKLPLAITSAQLRDPNFNIRTAWKTANPDLSFEEAVHIAHVYAVSALVILKSTTQAAAGQLATRLIS